MIGMNEGRERKRLNEGGERCLVKEVVEPWEKCWSLGFSVREDEGQEKEEGEELAWLDKEGVAK